MKADRADLVARLTTYQMAAQVFLTGYNALLSYGVNFMALPEWKDNGVLDEARKLKPVPAQEKTMAYLMRLENAIKAAVRRKTGIRLHTDNTTPTE